MDISFENESLRYFEALPPAVCTHEETTEVIVPDAMPDVGSILMSDGIALLRGKEAQQDKLLISGVCELHILYMPEEGGSLRRLDLELPFEAACEYPGLTELARTAVSVSLMGAEARLLNSRKLLLRAEVLLSGCGYLPRQLRWNVNCAGGEALEVHRESRRICPITEVTEKTFSAGERFALPGGKLPVERILNTRVALQPEESSTVGAKLILRGSLTAELCYLSGDGQLTSADFRTPYSVILELEEERAGELAETELCFTGLHVDVPEPGSISVEVGAVAQAVLRSPLQISWISDAYSTRWALEGSYETVELDTDVQQSHYEDSLRMELEGLKAVRNVADTALSLSRPRQEGDRYKVTVTARALCSDDSGAVTVLSGKADAACPVSASGRLPRVKTGTVYSSAAGGRGELRIPVSFQTPGGKKGRLTLLTQARLDPEQPASEAGMPSVSLLRLEEGDSLWALGKRRAVNQQLLRQVNGLGPEEHPAAGQLLLILRQR